jgi:YD repeat-containing protein
MNDLDVAHMGNHSLKRLILRVVVALFAIGAIDISFGAAGIERYDYDALGRLEKVTFADQSTIVYTYDLVGNRKSTGPVQVPKGTFTYISGSHTSLGNSGDIATATIKNSGAGTITGINYTCNGGSFAKYGNAATSLVAGASATYQCRAAASGSYTLSLNLTGVDVTNSPFTTPAW